MFCFEYMLSTNSLDSLSETSCRGSVVFSLAVALSGLMPHFALCFCFDKQWTLLRSLALELLSLILSLWKLHERKETVYPLCLQRLEGRVLLTAWHCCTSLQFISYSFKTLTNANEMQYYTIFNNKVLWYCSNIGMMCETILKHK